MIDVRKVLIANYKEVEDMGITVQMTL